MAFETFNILIARGKMNRQATETSIITHYYLSAIDTLATIQGANYFPAFLGSTSENVKLGDQINIKGSDGTAVVELTALDPVTLLAAGGLTELTTVVNTSWGGAFSTPEPRDITIKKIGTLCVAHFADLTATADTSSPINSTVAIPAAFRPSLTLGEQSRALLVQDNGPFFSGTITVINTTGFCTIYPTFPGTLFSGLGAGTTGFKDMYISWFTD